MAKSRKSRALGAWGPDHPGAEDVTRDYLTDARSKMLNYRCKDALKDLLGAAGEVARANLMTGGSKAIREEYGETVEGFEKYCMVSNKLSGAPKRKKPRKK
jgi:hypothetical protein